MDSDENGQGGEDDQRKLPSPKSLIVRILSAEKRKLHRYKRRKQSPDTEHQQNERTMARWTRGLGIFTIILVIVGAVTAWILYKTDQTARLSNRAFVAVRSVEGIAAGSNPSGDDIIYRVVILWENNGNTETRDLKIGGDLIMDVKPQDPPWQPKEASSQVILPKATYPSLTFYISGKQANQIRDSKIFIFSRGFAKYKDTFGDKHLTLACFKLQVGAAD